MSAGTTEVVLSGCGGQGWPYLRLPHSHPPTSSHFMEALHVPGVVSHLPGPWVVYVCGLFLLFFGVEGGGHFCVHVLG
jgi:hypothetical protein